MPGNHELGCRVAGNRTEKFTDSHDPPIQFFRHQPAIDRVIFLAVPHRGSRLAAGLVGSVVNLLIEHSKSPAQAMKELATQYPGILDPYE
jgi:hypothetical protein